jgi:nicotinate-nucleotide adenylyltransferase
MKIGILGGTFDPIHIGHLIIAQEALWQCGLDRVLFMVTALPPHKKEPRATAKARYEMVELALDGMREFQPSRLEIDRGGSSYTVQTLRELHRLYPESAHYWIVGGDSILEFQTWEDPGDVIALANLIVAPRPGFDLSKVDAALENKIILLNNSPQVNISSTELRKRLREGAPVRFLIPKVVEEYIYGHRLYLK